MNLQRLKPIKKARIGLYSVGMASYWDQFKGLRERLIGYNEFIAQRMSGSAEVFNFGLVDSDAKGHAAGEYFNANNVDLLFCHVATYALSADHLPAARICKKPVIILNLQPTDQMNYAKTGIGEWLAHVNGCAIPECTNGMTRLGIQNHLVSGLLGMDSTPAISVTNEATSQHPAAVAAWREIEQWIRAASVVRMLEHARIAMLGHIFSGMADLYTDYTLVDEQLGVTIPTLEIDDVARLVDSVTEAEKRAKLDQIRAMFAISDEKVADEYIATPTAEDLDWTATVSAAQDKLVREFDLDGIAYHYNGTVGSYFEKLHASLAVGHTILTGQGIPCAGEGDLKTCLAMKITDALDVGGQFTQVLAADYVSNTLLMGHDGPFHMGIADGKPTLRRKLVIHGKHGSGVAVEATVKKGAITNLGLTQDKTTLRLIAHRGRTVEGQILQIGDTQTHVDVGMEPARFMNEWFGLIPQHHWSMSVGDNLEQFRKVAQLLRLPFDVVEAAH
jgi:L-arabinose isomerase